MIISMIIAWAQKLWWPKVGPPDDSQRPLAFEQVMTDGDNDADDTGAGGGEGGGEERRGRASAGWLAELYSFTPAFEQVINDW